MDVINETDTKRVNELAGKMAALEKRRRENTASPQFSELPLKAIKQIPELFQPRGGLVDEQHVQDLRRGLSINGTLDPLLILVVGNQYFIVDGHHRLAAYRRDKFAKGIPVTYFAGTVAEAVTAAGEANTKAKLIMTTQERQDYGWRLVRLGCYSRRQIVRAASIGDGQVSVMIRTLKDLAGTADDYPTWFKARNAAKGMTWEPLSDDEMEAKLDAQAAIYVDRLKKAFGPKLTTNPTMAARVLSLYFGNGLANVMEALKDVMGFDEFMEPLVDDSGEPMEF